MKKNAILAACLFTTVSMAQSQVQTDSVQTKRVSLDEVLVTGSRMPVNHLNMPFNVQVVEASEILAKGESNVLVALSGAVPSLFVTERGVTGFGVSTGGSGGIKIRGVGGSPTNEVLMLVDGVPQVASIFSHHVGDMFSAEQVERVEIFRGPASMLYGSNAMGGVINVITRKPEEAGAHHSLSAQYGSYNTSKFAFTNDAKFGKFTSLLSLNYDRTDGHRENFDFRQGGGYAKVGYEVSDNWQLQADYSLLSFLGHDPTYFETDGIYTQHIIRGAASVGADNQYEKTNGGIKLYYGYGNHFIYDPDLFHGLDDRMGLLAYQTFTPWRQNNTTAGIDFSRSSGEIPMSGGVELTEATAKNPTLMSRKNMSEYAGYVVTNQLFYLNSSKSAFLTLNAGVRYVYSDLFGSSWVPQGGFSLCPLNREKQTILVKGSVSKGYRNPSFKELYLYKLANDSLQPESMINYELSYQHYLLHNRLKLELTGYWADGKDLIQIVPHPELGHGLNENAGEFTNKGIEFSGSYQDRKWGVETSYSFLHTSVENLTGAPKHQFYLGAHYQIYKFRLDANVRHINGLYVSADIDDEQYTLLNAKLTYYFGKSELYVLFDNILNQEYTINYGYPMPGFMAFGGLKVRF